MANEITLQVTLAVSKGLLAAQRSIDGAITMTGAAMMHGVQTIGTAKENLALGDVGTPGMALLMNLDATNFVEVGADADSPFLKLKAGECALFRLAAGPVSCKANTAAVALEYWVLED
jgi:hypothetical protein